MKLTTIFCLVLFSFSSFAKTNVNILSWWGYISKEEITKIEESCEAKLSIDEYYSNAEFLRRWDEKRNSHDIIIYSKTIFETIKDSINKHKSIAKKANKYHPSIDPRIESLKLKNNTRVFMLSLTGFLWKKQVIELENHLSLNEMLNKAKGKIFLVVDDAVEGLELFKSMGIVKGTNDEIVINKVKEINTKILITNETGEIVANKNFAFAYFWSGGAVKELIERKDDLSFMIHPQLSQVTLDFVSVVSSNKSANCVFEILSGRDFLKRLQNYSYYFSPYGDLPESNQIFRDFHIKFFTYLKTHPWISSPSTKTFQQTNDSWKKLKLQFNKE